MSKKEDIEILIRILFDKFGKISLTPTETGKLIGRSPETLKKDRLAGIGLPFTRLNGKEAGKPLYNITTLAKHLVESEVKIL
jgi:hypothetical protein